MKSMIGIAIAPLLFAAPLIGAAQTLTLKASGTPAVLVGAAELKVMPHQAAGATDRGQAHTYRGAPIALVLSRLGVPQGDAVRGKAMATVIVVSGSDGYRVVLTLPEIDPAFRDEKVLLADSEDGHPLDAREGPFRLIVEGNKRQARWVRGVTTLEVISIP
jgi:hypothetical protein